MKLMIVDDHAGSRGMIRELLAGLDLTFCECTSGEEAVRCVREFKPDWVTMDVRMPGMNGFKAALELRKIHPPARVVMVTADDQLYLYPLARSVGALGPIGKEKLFELQQMVSSAVLSSRAASDKSGSPTEKPNPSL